MEKKRVGVIGATGMVGQRLLLLLEKHPYFEVQVLAASARSAGKNYEEAVGTRWKLSEPMPQVFRRMPVLDASDVPEVAGRCDFVFCAVNGRQDAVRELEEAYARAECPVVSNNSANRCLSDVPMLIPEINPEHLAVIPEQKRRLGSGHGFIVVKPNCSVQSYVPALAPLLRYGIREVVVSTYQAISGAGKIFSEWREMEDNVIPWIRGEEEKSEVEPRWIFGSVREGKIHAAEGLRLSAQCIRVPVTDGHIATVFVKFCRKPTKEEILSAWSRYSGKPQALSLPHAPKQFLTYFEEEDRPQPRLDRDLFGGMGIALGRLREDPVFDYKFVGLSHNTLRGAAGGAVLTAELLYREGYF